jgi:hypothetical protein
MVPRLTKDRESVSLKFVSLIQAADSLAVAQRQPGGYTDENMRLFAQIRVSALNLLARLGSSNSVYYREFLNSEIAQHFTMSGILRAAHTDYLEGYLADHSLLISAEVFDDLLVQAEVLLEHAYKDAAAVLIRAVLEDALRRLCAASQIDMPVRASIQQLNEELYKKKAYTLLQHKEITAKAEVGNNAAHGRFDAYNEPDVRAFLDYVRRFLVEHLR